LRREGIVEAPDTEEYSIAAIIIPSLTYNIVTLNINGIQSGTKMSMLNDYCIHHDIDILLLQEVTHNKFEEIQHSNIYINTGTEGRGTAIITKQHIKLRGIQRLPSGRGISVWWNELYIVNVYAPSGAGRRKERDDFYTLELPHTLQMASKDYIIAGDLVVYYGKTNVQGHLLCVNPWQH
jgi:exonuclease III